MPRFFLLLITLCFTFCAHAEGFITRLLDKPVPGGVAVVPLGNGPTAPKATYQGKPVMVVHEEGQRWIAIVGIPLTIKPGQQTLTVNGSRTETFAVRSRHYKEQHITLKNDRQVNPNPADLKRIERELAEQTKAIRSFPPVRPVTCCWTAPSMDAFPARSACGAFSMARSATHIQASILPFQPVHQSRHQPQARSF